MPVTAMQGYLLYTGHFHSPIQDEHGHRVVYIGSRDPVGIRAERGRFPPAESFVGIEITEDDVIDDWGYYTGPGLAAMDRFVTVSPDVALERGAWLVEDEPGDDSE